MLDIEDINDAYKKVEDGEVRFRYVIDMEMLKRAQPSSKPIVRAEDLY